MKRFRVTMHYLNGDKPVVHVYAKQKEDLVVMKASKACCDDGLAHKSDMYTASKCKVEEAE